jgi:hypothetical protein
MTVRVRNYTYSHDFGRVSDFLVQYYQPDNRDGNWLQPAWEYMHSHPALDESALDRIRIWEDAEWHSAPTLAQAIEKIRVTAETIPFVAQRTKNTTPAILIHLISNGIGVLLSVLPLLTA